MIEFPPPIPGQRIKISASRFTTFRNCKYAAAAQFTGEYEWDPPTLPTFLGKLSHRMFARELTDGPLDTANFGQICREEIGRDRRLNRELNELSLKPSHLSSHFEDLALQHEKFQTLPIDRDQVEAAEYILETSPAPDLTLGGVVDAVIRHQDSLRIIDWKTGGLWNVEIQLNYYALVWALKYEEIPTSLEGRSLSGELYVATPTEAQLQNLADEVSEMATDIRRVLEGQHTVPTRGGTWCRFCKLLPDCDEGRAAALLLGFPDGVNQPKAKPVVR